MSSQHSGIDEIAFRISTNEKGKIEALYIKIRSGKSTYSIPVGPNCEAVLDFNRNDQLIGIEMLEPGHLNVKEIQKISKKYKEPALNRLAKVLPEMGQAIGV